MIVELHDMMGEEHYCFQCDIDRLVLFREIESPEPYAQSENCKKTPLFSAYKNFECGGRKNPKCEKDMMMLEGITISLAIALVFFVPVLEFV
jgi:hypothetical protein